MEKLPVYSTKWSSNREEDRFVVNNPATGKRLAIVHGSGAQEVDSCVRAADKVFRDSWRWVEPHVRGRMLKQAARLIEQHLDEIAELETMEEGKPIAISRGDVKRCIEAFEYFGGLAGNMPSELFDMGPTVSSVFLEPFGVVAGIIPFNWPPVHTAAKTAPALAVGNTVVLKPGDQAPLSIMRIVELLQSVFPADVVQLVTGPGAETGIALTGHPLVRKISFTGSTNSGKAVLRQAAENVTPCMMELGGKNALIVMPGCDLDEIIPVAYDGAFTNNGQACTATSRLLIHRSLADEFTARFAEIVKKMRVGNGLDETVHVGPLVTAAQQQRVLDYIALGQKEGAVIAAQASLPTDPEYAEGYFVPPTLFSGVTPDMRIAKEEMFGPVTCVIPFDEPEEAVRIANDSDYGLVGIVYSPDANLASRVSRQLDVGTVYVNNFYRAGQDIVPFGGTKESGYGRERTIETLREFGYHKVVKTSSGLGVTRLSVPAELL